VVVVVLEELLFIDAEGPILTAVVRVKATEAHLPVWILLHIHFYSQDFIEF
jgi:hypothetical protein